MSLKQTRQRGRERISGNILKYVKILTNWSSVEWGMDGRFLLLTSMLCSFALSKDVHGGPTQPATETEVMNSGLQEVSPQILDVIVRRGDPFIEIYIQGLAYRACYDIHEYDVERTATKTVIIPRLKRSKPGEPCEQILEEFEDKVADLDPNLDSAYSLEILGYKGWYKKVLPRP